ncbi:hypothetical protein D3C86_2035860 [compost metagenome]
MQRTAIGSTVTRIEPISAGGKAERDGTVPQTRPVSTITVKESTMGSSGRKPTQPSVPHSRPDNQVNAAASQAQRMMDCGSLGRLKNRRETSTRMMISR